jgi:hypothetical protein
MAPSQSFGRRGLSSDAPPRKPTVEPDPLIEVPNPQLEAFRASLKGAAPPVGLGEDQAFEAWMRQQRPRRLLLIGVRIAFLAPGAACFALHAPWWVSLTLEGAGLFANGWIKSERVRQVQAIARWSADS